MNRQARRIVFKKWLDLLCASGRKHFRRSYRHIVQQGTLIFSPRAMNLQRGNSPSIGFFFVQFDEIFAIGQALAEPIKSEHPWTGAAQHALEVCSKARHPSASFPVLSRSPTLETVSTKQARMLLLDITEARNIDAVRAMPERILIFAIGQALAEPIKSEHPWTGAAQHALEVCSKARHPSASFPVLSRSPTLETVSTKQARMLLLDITEARNIDAVRAMPERILIFV